MCSQAEVSTVSLEKRHTGQDMEATEFDLESGRQSDQSASEKKIKTPVHRQDNACTECRKHKIRCHPGDASRWPCRRCIKQSLHCEVLQHHRGRKRKQPPGDASQDQNNKREVMLHSNKAEPDYNIYPEQSTSSAELAAVSPANSRPTPESERYGDQRRVSLDLPRSPQMSSLTDATAGAGSTGSSRYSPAPMSFPLHPPSHRPPTSSVGSDHPTAHASAPAPALPGAPLSAMRFPFLDGNATDPSQHAGQRVSMFSLKSLLNGQESADPSLPAASPIQRLATGQQPAENDPEVYNADPVSCGLMDISTAHAHFQRFLSEINPLVFVFDVEEHSHDRVRASSAFLYSTVIAVSTKYGTTTAAEREVNQQCWTLVKNHIKMSAFRDERSIERVMALLVLGAFGEVEEKSTSSIFPIAVSTARLLGLGRMSPQGTSQAEQKVYRICQRIWLALFVCNSVAFLQHNLYQSITWTDPLVTHASNWHEDASPAMRSLDTLLIASVQNRRAMFHYQALLANLVGPANTSINATSLSIITRSAQRDMDQTNSLWRDEMERIGAPDWMHHKSIVWHNASKLKLNLSIVTHALRATGTNFAPPNVAARQSDVGGLLSFHIAIISATTVLETFLKTAAKAVVFSSDSFLHLLLYASFFLWSISADSNEAFMGRREAEDCTQLISRVAAHLQSCSFDAQDSCGLHARFLRLLLQTPASSLPAGPARPGTGTRATSSEKQATRSDSSLDATADIMIGLGNPISVPPTSSAFDPVPQLGAMATDPAANTIDLNALFNGRVTDEFAWAFPSAGSFEMDMATPDMTGGFQP